MIQLVHSKRKGYGNIMEFISSIKSLLSVLLSLVALIGGAISGNSSVKQGDIKLVNEYTYNLADGTSFGQGLTTDGEYFYGFGAIKVAGYNAITKIDAKTGEIVKVNDFCIPKNLMLKGYSHVGDGDYYNGKLYVACEDLFFTNPAILVYDAETLDFIEHHTLPKNFTKDDHLPWCTVYDGVIYLSEFRNVDSIKMLSLEDFSSLGEIKLNTTLNKVQGGDIYEGVLYLATDDGNIDKPTYSVNLETGEVQLEFIRSMGRVNSEAEGMAVYPFEDGSLFHLVDVGSSVYIRSYAVAQ